MLIKLLVLILVNDSISGNKKRKKNTRALSTRSETESNIKHNKRSIAERQLQCEQIIRPIRLMNFRFILRLAIHPPEEES